MCMEGGGWVLKTVEEEEQEERVKKDGREEGRVKRRKETAMNDVE